MILHSRFRSIRGPAWRRMPLSADRQWIREHTHLELVLGDALLDRHCALKPAIDEFAARGPRSDIVALSRDVIASRSRLWHLVHPLGLKGVIFTSTDRGIATGLVSRAVEVVFPRLVEQALEHEAGIYGASTMELLIGRYSRGLYRKWTVVGRLDNGDTLRVRRAYPTSQRTVYLGEISRRAKISSNAARFP